MALVTQTQTNWGPHAPDIASGALFGVPLLPNEPSWPEAGLATGWVVLPGDAIAEDALGLNVEAASLQLNPPGCAGQPATLTVTMNTVFAAPFTPGAENPIYAVGVSDGAGNWIVPPSPNPPSASPTVLTLPLTAAEAAAGYWVSVLFSINPNPTGTYDFTTGDANGITATAVVELEYDDAACPPVDPPGCAGEATHLDSCGVAQWSDLLQQTVDALRPLVRWSTICDDGAIGVTAWQKWSSTDNGLTWTLLGTFTEKYGSTLYVPVGALVDCSTIDTASSGTRARRAVLATGSSTVVPSGLPSIGALVESLSWSSRNATGTITDAAGTVSTFVAGEGDTWTHEWIDNIQIDVTTGEVVVTWAEVY